jgi:hypothetical protein
VTDIFQKNSIARVKEVKDKPRSQYLSYPLTKSGILWFWSRLLPPETVWFLEATDHNFEGIVIIFGIYLLGVKVSPPIKNGQGLVIAPEGPKTTQIKHFFHIFHCVA